MTDAWRFKTGLIASDVRAGQPLLIEDDGTLHRTNERPNCVALETIEMDHTAPEKRCNVMLLDAQPPAYAIKVCNCGHSASQHRSSDDHCNAAGCSCVRPSCGH